MRVLAGLELGPGDEVLTAPDEHPGLLGPLATLRARRGVHVRAVPFADLADAVGPATKLVACSHVSWITGALRPDGLAGRRPGAARRRAGRRGGAVDVGALGCAFYAGSGQKWLCGPVGTGMLWVAPGVARAPRARGADLHEPRRPRRRARRRAAADAPPPRRRRAVARDARRRRVAAHDVLAAPAGPTVHERARDAGRAARRAARRARPDRRPARRRRRSSPGRTPTPRRRATGSPRRASSSATCPARPTCARRSAPGTTRTTSSACSAPSEVARH